MAEKEMKQAHQVQLQSQQQNHDVDKKVWSSYWSQLMQANNLELQMAPHSLYRLHKFLNEHIHSKLTTVQIITYTGRKLLIISP